MAEFVLDQRMVGDKKVGETRILFHEGLISVQVYPSLSQPSTRWGMVLVK
jgi:hypothetical protein